MGQGYAKGTGLPLTSRRRVNPARVGEGKPVVENKTLVRLPVMRKPAKNKAAK